MNRSDLFVWASLVAMLGGLYWLRAEQLIRFDFNLFAFAILAMSAGVVLVVWIVRPVGKPPEASAERTRAAINDRE